MNTALKIRKSRLFRPWDLLILAVIIVTGVFAVFFALNNNNGETVEISLNGEVIYNLPLDEDRTIEIEGIGKVIIADSTVKLIESTCPDHLCELQGEISSAGESIICLPNKLIITIKGDSEWDVIL